VKKLISIGVALALLAMVVTPVAVAAATPPDPETSAKIPFSIIQSGFYLLDEIMGPLLTEFAPDMGWIQDLMIPIGDWTGGPLGWSVDMLAWGMALGADVWALADSAFDIGFPDIANILDIMADGLTWCFVGGNCTPMP